MQPYGKIVEIRNSCMCCGTSKCSRADAKIELRKIIQEEADEVVLFGSTVPKSEKYDYCSVCEDYNNPECSQNC
jgi:hypothetical protein